MPDVLLRTETEHDVDAIDDVVDRAFASTAESRLVHAIRASEGYIPELTIVAIAGDRVVGHVMVSRAELEDVDAGGARYRITTLAPLAVHPEFQAQGIGSALMRDVVQRADALGVALIVLEGSPLYYPRFGFRHSVPLGITMQLPDWAPREAAMALPLAAYQAEMRGKVVYTTAFQEVLDHDD